MSKALQTAIIRALQRLPEGQKPHLGNLRRDVAKTIRREITVAEFRTATEALYFAGKVDHHLNLSPSMRCPAAPQQARPTSEAEEPPSRSAASLDPLGDACGAAPPPERSFDPALYERRRLTRIDISNAPSGMELAAAAWKRKAVGQ